MRLFIELRRQSKSSLLNLFCKKGVLENFAKFTRKHLCQSLFFLFYFIKKDTLAQVSSRCLLSMEKPYGFIGGT